ncbi:Cyclin-L1-1 [Acorus calamus]|uniref:Cyclin-L1-1 n=1 Tax=Acorus calamus TaxID=4465 RepID=A0AAV9CI04_ACOCL|nr:Cyclin-L1-1 [Acorus calamus]
MGETSTDTSGFKGSKNCIDIVGSEVVACGVVYAVARGFKVPLPENPPWWLAFDADQSEIEEVCRVLAHLYSLPKAQKACWLVPTSPKDSLVKATSDKSKELKKNNDDVDNMPVDGEAREDQATKAPRLFLSNHTYHKKVALEEHSQIYSKNSSVMMKKD